MDGLSQNIQQEKINSLKNIFPEVFTEGQIDFKKLKGMLGDSVIYANEHYELTWANKAEARKEVQKQTTCTLEPDKNNSVKFDEANNIFIEGENLEVLRILQKSYFGKIKVIYIDPPYNTGNDSFVYPDDYSERQDEYNKRTGRTDDDGYLNKQDLWKKNSKENGHFHSSWLSMMYPRLYLSRNLLSENGVIFVSIDDNEQANLKLILNEIFGEENFVSQLVWKSRQNKDNRNVSGVSVDHEYVFCYAKNSTYRSLKGSERKTNQYTNPDEDPRGDWTSGNMVGLLPEHLRPNCHYDLIHPTTGTNYGKPKMGWRYDKKTMQSLINEDKILWPTVDTGRPRRKKFLSELSDSLAGYSSIIGKDIYTRNGTSEIEELFGVRYFDFPKPVNLIKELLQQTTNKDDSDIVMDFFAGSSTTAHAVSELNYDDDGNRKFILVQMAELLEEKSEAVQNGFNSIADISKERIKKVIEKYAVDEDKNGVKFFKLCQSNFSNWRNDIAGKEAILNQLKIFVHSDKPGSIASNMVFELLLKLGKPLDTKIDKIVVEKNEFYYIESYKLAFCLIAFDSAIKSTIHDMDIKQVIILNRLFNNDEDLSNTKLEFKESSINLVII
ncbi:site-specific DNA-methyltransferase [Pedobacter frigidisoli]|uniref:site-specific DNA-methyltransferase n=1 Tax=Pedobacter frigidisoli TaxID=2530455 RepID=UPI00293164FB|nr:site-specific DNA-methyltransferase [Pedobacter frigidisoli]